MDFAPGENDVILGRGKACYCHTGNRRLSDIVKSCLGEYSGSDSKKRKSELINEIIERVRASSDGGFVRFDVSKQRYFEVGTHVAREQISQSFRNALSEKYKSSTAAKALKRKQRQSRNVFSMNAAKTALTQYFPPGGKQRFQGPTSEQKFHLPLLDEMTTMARSTVIDRLLSISVSNRNESYHVSTDPGRLYFFNSSNSDPATTTIMKEQQHGKRPQLGVYGLQKKFSYFHHSHI